MSTIQKILLAFACIFFAVTIYGLFNFEVYLIVLFFLLHCLCLILFCYRTYSDVRGETIFMETREQDIGQEIAEKNKEVQLLNERVNEKEEEKKRLAEENESLKQKCGGFENKIRDLETEKTALEEVNKRDREMAESIRNAGTLLPPETPGEKEESVDIIAIANAARDELMEDAKKVNMAINISSASESLMIKADRNRLNILFRNIIDNSIKYMKKAGSLVITISTLGDDIFIVLKDTGEGLPEEETKHVFELNFQGSNRISGNGLGLAQAKSIVEYYGGTIYAKSDEGRGMGIYIQLPADKA
ncbi:MAG: HAMP domain-containing histidine kinase [Lachnospiraceae bacterium]|nr:HAMP domain-containing histidine kinase [Lachnospiraceae bacterium]